MSNLRPHLNPGPWSKSRSARFKKKNLNQGVRGPRGRNWGAPVPHLLEFLQSKNLKMSINFAKSNIWYLLGCPYLKLASTYPPWRAWPGQNESQHPIPKPTFFSYSEDHELPQMPNWFSSICLKKNCSNIFSISWSLIRNGNSILHNKSNTFIYT